MMRTVFWMAACFLSLLGSVPSQACTFTEPAFWRDKPINILSDGSFNKAEESSLGSISGKAPVDIGRGKIGQRITFAGPCAFWSWIPDEDRARGRLRRVAWSVPVHCSSLMP